MPETAAIIVQDLDVQDEKELRLRFMDGGGTTSSIEQFLFDTEKLEEKHRSPRLTRSFVATTAIWHRA